MASVLEAGGSRYFYPRSPCGERLKELINKRCELNFYPRSPCGERPVKLFRQNYECFISIHALLAESDFSLAFGVLLTCIFLSTLSLRRATFQGPRLVRHGVNFYPRSPCGERLCATDFFWNRRCISIHALLAESDLRRLKSFPA